MIIPPRRGEAIVSEGKASTRFAAFLESIQDDTSQLLTDTEALQAESLALQAQTTQLLSNTDIYTVTNPSDDREYDANAAAGAITSPPTQAEVENIRDAVLELADVLGTLIADLKTSGVIQ